MKLTRLSTATGIGIPFMVACALAAQAETPSLSAALSLILKEGRPLPALEILRIGAESGRLPAATSAQFYAISGDAIGTAQMNDRGAKPSRKESLQIVQAELDVRPAIAEIVRASAGKQVVMLNEDHYHQLHRAFGLLLLMELSKEGFTHFGAETFGPSLQESMLDRAPDLDTGIYTSDPLYADMTRQAIALGYSLFDYEQRPNQESSVGTPEDQRLARESAQASNIAAVLKANPTARIFIYAGSGHIAESTEPDGREWMALRLKREYEIDPLTVNQVVGTPRSRPELDSAIYHSVSTALTHPSIVHLETGPLTVPGFDMVVFHPRQQLVNGRPTWLGMNGYRSPCRVQVKPSRQASLIRAFVATEEPRSIPMDQILISSGAREATLMLPEGSYRLVRESFDDDQALGTWVVNPSIGEDEQHGPKRELCMQSKSRQ